MRFPFYLRSFMLRLCVACCVAGIATSLCARTQNPQAIIDLNACGHLKVFDDGTVRESRHGKTTERRLSESRLRRLRKLIANFPCAKEWKPKPSAPLDLTSPQAATVATDFDCAMEYLGYPEGAGLIEVTVDLRYREIQTGPFPVYIVCKSAKQSDKAWAKLNYQRFLKRNWLRFLKDVVSATDSSSTLKSCDCAH